MSINLYSTGTVDSLLAAKLSDAPIDGSTYGRNNGAWAVVSGGGGLTISTLSNAATSTLAAAVPTAGQALTYDGTDLIWATVSGGVAWGAITGTLSSQTDLQSELDLKANLNSPVFTSGIECGGVTLTGPSGNPTFTYSGLDLSPSSGGITFADSTVQSTAAVAPPSADVLTANAIASNIGSMGYGSSAWAGNGLPSIAGLIGWGIYNATDGLIAYSYSTGNTFYLASSPTTLANSSVQVNGSNSSFYVA